MLFFFKVFETFSLISLVLNETENEIFAKQKNWSSGDDACLKKGALN